MRMFVLSHGKLHLDHFSCCGFVVVPNKIHTLSCFLYYIALHHHDDIIHTVWISTGLGLQLSRVMARLRGRTIGLR